MRNALVALLVMSATAQAEPPRKPHKSLRAALGWSLGVTAFGVATGIASARTRDPGEQSALVAMSGVSLLAGPSIGRFYTAHYVTAGVITRVIGLGVVAMGQSLACLQQGTGPAGPSSTCGGRFELDGPTYLGAGIMALGAAWDLASIPEDVDDYNTRATLAPAALRTPAGIAPGLALAGRF